MNNKVFNPVYVPLNEANINQLISFASNPRGLFNLDEDSIYTECQLRNLILNYGNLKTNYYLSIENIRNVLNEWAEKWDLADTLFIGDMYVFPTGDYTQRRQEFQLIGNVMNLYGLSNYCVVYKSLDRILYLKENYYNSNGKDINLEYNLERISITDYLSYLESCNDEMMLSKEIMF